MSKAKSIRKKVLKRNKNKRRSLEGQPKAKTKRRQMFMMMKNFNKFVQRKMMEGKIIGHKEAGLPEEIDGHIYDDIHSDRFQEIHNVESIVNEDEGEKNVLPEEDNNNS